MPDRRENGAIAQLYPFAPVRRDIPHSEINLQGRMPEPVGISAIGEQRRFPSGEILQRPHPLYVAHLMSADPRVRYFPVNLDLPADNSNARKLFYRTFFQKIGSQVREDFPDDDIYVRGSVATLRRTEPLLYWNRDFSSGPDRKLVPLTSISEVLASGSDDGGSTTAIADISPTGELHFATADWLFEHFRRVFDNHGKRANDAFPILLVYDRSVFSGDKVDLGYNRLVGEPSERIAALYITDKTIKPEQLA